MARRKELTNIATGIAGSFNSRNNDVGGYWGIGKLYEFAQVVKSKKIEIDLIHKAVSPSTNEFSSLLLHYHTMLSNHLLSLRIPLSWVVSAKVTATFESELQPNNHFWRSGLGKPCVVSCDIVDDKGRHHMAFAYNNCKPHDPNKETKSNRANDF